MERIECDRVESDQHLPFRPALDPKTVELVSNTCTRLQKKAREGVGEVNLANLYFIIYDVNTDSLNVPLIDPNDVESMRKSPEGELRDVIVRQHLENLIHGELKSKISLILPQNDDGEYQFTQNLFHVLLNPQEHLSSLCERAKDIMIDAFGFEEVEMNNFKDDVRRQYQVSKIRRSFVGAAFVQNQTAMSTILEEDDDIPELAKVATSIKHTMDVAKSFKSHQSRKLKEWNSKDEEHQKKLKLFLEEAAVSAFVLRDNAKFFGKTGFVNAQKFCFHYSDIYEELAIELLQCRPSRAFEIISKSHLDPSYKKGVPANRHGSIVPGAPSENRASLLPNDLIAITKTYQKTILEIAKIGKLSRFVWDEVIQRQLGFIFRGGLKRSATFRDQLRFWLGIVSFGTIPAIFGDTFYSGYFKMDSLKFYNQKMWGDMFGPGYFEFDSSVSFHRTDLKCFDFAERDKFMKRSFLDRIQFRFYTWHFSNRVMVTYNFLSEVIFVLVLVLYASTAACSYQWTFFDSFIFYLFLLVTLSKLRPALSRKINATKMYLKRTSISFFTWFYGIAYVIYLAAVFCRLIFTLWTPDEVFTQSFRDGIPLTSTDDKYIISNDTVREMYLNFYGKNQTLKSHSHPLAFFSDGYEQFFTFPSSSCPAGKRVCVQEDLRQFAFLGYFLINMTMFFQTLTLMRFFLYSKHLGPLVMALYKTIVSVGHFFIVVLVFMLPIGVVLENLILPNNRQSSGNLGLLQYVLKAAFKPYFMLYGEAFLSEVTIDAYENPDDCRPALDTSDLPRCPETTVLSTMVTACFMLVSNLILLNILIAVFTEKYQDVQHNINTVWTNGRLDVVLEDYHYLPLGPFFGGMFQLLLIVWFLICAAIRLPKYIYLKYYIRADANLSFFHKSLIARVLPRRPVEFKKRKKLNLSGNRFK